MPIFTRYLRVQPRLQGPQCWIRFGVVNVLKANALFSVRNQGIRANLDDAVRQQANAFLQRYSHTQDIVKAMQLLYPQIQDLSSWPPKVSDSSDWKGVTGTAPASVLGRLGALSSAASERFQQLKAAYTFNGSPEGVLTSLVGGTTPTGTVSSTTFLHGFMNYVPTTDLTTSPGDVTIKDSSSNPYQSITYRGTH